MAIAFDRSMLVPRASTFAREWTVWEKKTFNIHRGVIDWNVRESFDSIDQVASKIRAGVLEEFRPNWFRGFGFGVMLHMQVVPPDASKICNYIDTRNKRGGVWQWAVLCFDEDRRAIGIHTWLHGYLRPVYESALCQLVSQGYECESIDSDVDKLFVTLGRIATACRVLKILGGSLG
jgi:hypothetical protein